MKLLTAILFALALTSTWIALSSSSAQAMWDHERRWLKDTHLAQWEEDVNYAWILASTYAQWLVDARAAAEVVSSSRASRPLHSGGAGYCSVDYLAQFGFENPAYASSVCRCESRGDPGASNSQYDGIFQLSDYHTAQAGGNDPGTQAAYVADYTNERGWEEWSCR